MAKLKTEHLVKPLALRPGPAGLYPEPLFWMEGADMEGFNGQFAYTVVKQTGSFHPAVGMIAHPYDELLVFAGLNPRDILYLGAEISVELGAEREKYIFTEPTVVVIPKGTPHGPAEVRRLYKPFAHFTIALAGAYAATAQTVAQDISEGGQYAHLVKRLITHVDDALIGTGMGYELCTDARGVMKSSLAPHGMLGPGNSDELIWMFGKDLEQFDVNFLWGHYSKAGKWHRDGEAHTHPEEEILLWVGFNPDDPGDLGCEIEMGMGEDDERHIFSVPSVAICPKGFPHLPEITRWADRPYGFIVACLSGEHDSPWTDAEAAGR
jgi:hypothetical protein